MFKKIKAKLHKLLFPSFDLELFTLRDEVIFNEEYIKNTNKVMDLLRKEKSVSKEPTLSDLTKKFLNGYEIDFFNVKRSDDPEENGYPNHFLNIEDKDKRSMYIGQLAQIQTLEVWPVMLQYHINTQGNFIARKAEGDIQMLCGRMTMNGVSLLRNEVQKGFEEYQEGRKPPEDFDEHEVSEGIIISNIIENQDVNKSN